MKKVIVLFSLILFLSLSTFAGRPVRDACHGVTPNRPNTGVLKAQKVINRHHKTEQFRRKVVEKVTRRANLSGAYAWY